MELFRQGKKRTLSKPDSRQMDESLFWQIIEEAKNNTDSVMERPGELTSLLEKYTATSIKKFSSLFQNKLDLLYRQDVWAIAYIALGGCSDDGFEYFRCWLISEGKSIFDAIIADPESVIELSEQPLELEAMLYATDEAYERRANKVLPPRSAKRVNLAGKEWTEEELPKLFPKACKKFGWAL